MHKEFWNAVLQSYCVSNSLTEPKILTVYKKRRILVLLIWKRHGIEIKSATGNVNLLKSRWTKKGQNFRNNVKQKAMKPLKIVK